MLPTAQGAGEEFPPEGAILPLDIVPSESPVRLAKTGSRTPRPQQKLYSPERQRDWVRLIVACGLLFILGYVIMFATVEATSWPTHWAQTKEMLQIILPALTGVIGTVIGFYFGTAAVANSKDTSNDSQ